MGTEILHSIVLCIPSLMEKKLHKEHREARGHRIYTKSLSVVPTYNKLMILLIWNMS